MAWEMRVYSYKILQVGRKMCIGENLLNRNATNSMRNAPLQVICVNQHHDSDNSTSRRGEALGAPFPPTPDVSVSILFYFKPSRNQPRHCNIKRVNMHFLYILFAVF